MRRIIKFQLIWIYSAEWKCFSLVRSENICAIGDITQNLVLWKVFLFIDVLLVFLIEKAFLFFILVFRIFFFD